MIDLVKLKLIAGDGGDGRVSLHREKYRPKGGPDGGDGGDGGHIILRGNKNLNTLKSFAGVKEYVAASGQAGGKNKQHGSRGKNVVLEVPLGTVVWLTAENKISQVRRKKYQRPAVNFDFETKGGDQEQSQSKIDDKTQKTSSQLSPFRFNVTLQKDEVGFEKYYLDWNKEIRSTKTQDKISSVDPDQEEVSTKQFTQFDKVSDSNLADLIGIKLVEIREHNQEEIICQGGFGGRGNHAFKAATHQTPLEAEYGTFGEKKEVVLELRLLADLGLVGLPNAGKSTLLSRLTKAHPKIADYPFTTLEPNLGVMVSANGKKELVVADIPGLIEKASLGKGLGDRFLRHIENCQILMYVLFLEEHQVFESKLSQSKKAQLVWQQYQLLQDELGAYNQELLNKPYLVTLNKIDLYPPELLTAIQKKFQQNQLEIIPFSGITGEGLEVVRQEVFKL